MKYLTSELIAFVRQRPGQRNVRLLLRFAAALLFLILIYSATFHLLMKYEKQEHSWLTGLYWTLTVMSTLGFGDITFTSDLGRAFSIAVLLSGIIFLLVILPFTFIQFFYAPWIEAQSEARAPRELPATTGGHVILTHYDPVTASLINKLTQYGYPYALIVADLDEALRLHDTGVRVVRGEPDTPETYHRLHVQKAALVAATGSDVMNTNVAFTVREISKTVPIIATASSASSMDVLELAGSSRVFQLGNLMGQSLARRTIAGDALAHVIGHFDKLLIAEATAAGTPLIGKTLAESRLRELAGTTVVGVWERGHFEMAGPDTLISPHTVLVLAGSAEQLRNYDEFFCIYHRSEAAVIIIGGGRVGRATGRALEKRKVDYRIVEQLGERIPKNATRYVQGNAADIETLERAGIARAAAVIITTHDDDTNIYLTLYCRKLRPDIQIISRATRDRNVSSLHRAGADFVMSYASMGANIIFNLLKRSDILMVAEGLNIFKVKIPPSLVGRSLIEAGVRQKTGCSVIAVDAGVDLRINPNPAEPLPEGEIILIGTVEAEKAFFQEYGAGG